MALWHWMAGIAGLVALGSACGGVDSPTTGSAGTGGATGSTTAVTGGSSSVATGGSSGTSTTSSTSTTSTSSTSTSSSSGAGGSVAGVSCMSPAPDGAPHAAPPKPYSGGACPMLVQGDNAFVSTGHMRKVKIAIPANLDPSEKLPVIFLWHWLGASAQSFYDKGEVQAAVDTQRFLAVLPDKKGDLLFDWPFNVADTQARLDEDLAFFDDLLACVSAQFNVIPDCVSSVGVSAGALFTDQLAGARADYLASFMSLSGGVDGVIRPWAHPPHRLPGMVLWGGPSDICVVLNFETGSKALETALGQDGNFELECVHNCGHTEPPFEAPMGLSKYAGMWRFAIDHPFWLGAGQSPYTTDGLPLGMPEWCAIGKGNAVPRTGPCSGGGC